MRRSGGRTSQILESIRKFARRLRERRRKEGQVRQIARQMTKSPAVIITEELGKNPQEEMIGVVERAKKA